MYTNNASLEDIKVTQLLQKYLVEYYNTRKLEYIKFDPNNNSLFLQKFSEILVPEEDATKASFILPKLGLFKTSCNIPNEVIEKVKRHYEGVERLALFLRVTHDIIDCFGFKLEDVWLAGGIRISYDEILKETCVTMNVSLFRPDKESLNYLEFLFNISDSCVYEILYKDGADEATFYRKVHSFTDIKKQINLTYNRSKK